MRLAPRSGSARFLLSVIATAFGLCGQLSGQAARAAELFIDPMFDVSVSSAIYTTAPTSFGGNVSLQMDIYRPTGVGLPATLPAVVLMHGGYYVNGSKAAMAGSAMALAERGYVAASIDYRKLDLLPPAPGAVPDPAGLRIPDWLPGQLTVWGATLDQYVDTIAAATSDLAAAVNYLADNAGTYNIDPQRMAVGGYSAGAVSSLMLGAGAIDGASADVRVAVSFAGGMFGLESAFGPGDAAVFAVHGTADTTVPYSEYPHLKQAVESVDLPFDSLILPGVGHGLSPSLLVADDSILRFLLNNMRPVPEPGTLALGGIGIASLLLAGRRSRKRRAHTHGN